MVGSVDAKVQCGGACGGVLCKQRGATELHG